MKRVLVYCLSMFFLLLSCNSDLPIDDNETKDEIVGIPDFLPLQQLEKSILDGASENWVLAGTVMSDMEVDQDINFEGEGDVIVNKATGDNLVLDIDHGDLELEVDFMVPKGSNSGLYFQGRYEVQILDSWGNDELTTADVGSIYPDHDEEANISSNGSVPTVNASRAPGLWQSFKVVFRAPKFDKNGNKTDNAKFEKVYLNGFLIQENIEAPKPTRAAMAFDEVATGPLMIQGDHGPVAFKNLKYKKMGFDTLALTDINYKLYKGGTFNSIPDFDAMTPVSEGTAKNLDELQDLAETRDHFALMFDGKLQVPKTGEYLLTTYYDDGGDVFIDGEQVLHNGPKEYENQPSKAILNLTEGAHDIKLTYYQEVWGSRIIFLAEGPEIPQHAVGCVNVFRNRGGNREQMLIDPKSEVELLRGYVNYGDEKKTHALSVGDPAGVNYTYDLMEGSLLKVWRGGFANVTNMWVGRGHSQILLPQNAATEIADGIPIANLSSASATWPAFRSDKYKNKGYKISTSGHPLFKYEMGNINISDQLKPSSNGNLQRTINFNSDSEIKNHYYKIAAADKIIKMKNGDYSIGGNYYLKTSDDDGWQIRTVKGSDELVTAAKDGGSINYEIIW